LNVLVSSFTLGPRASAKIPFPTPTRAVAWVTFGKYPSRRVTFSPDAVVVPAAPAVVVAGDPADVALDEPQAATSKSPARTGIPRSRTCRTKHLDSLIP